MNTEMINTDNELTLDQLDDVNGGIGPMGVFGIFAAGGLLGGLWYYGSEPSEEGTESLSNALNGDGVMARDNGRDCTGF